MDIVVVGSVALDTVTTPFATTTEGPGGSAFYFSLAAANFARVGVVGIVGTDFPGEYVHLLLKRGIDISGLEQRSGSTFRWEARYEMDMNARETLRTEVGVFRDFHPRLPQAYKKAKALFLANIDPHLQMEVLESAPGVDLVAVDTMNFWIEGDRRSVERVIARANVVIVNDEEVLMLSGESDAVRGAMAVRALGPEIVVVKKGAHGCAALGPWGWLLVPALPLERPVDPTGAGDAFAGGMMGVLAGRNWRQKAWFARALAAATSVASIVVEAAGCEGIVEQRIEEIRHRWGLLVDATSIEGPPRGVFADGS